MTAVATQSKDEVARPLRILASLIKDKLREADEAAEEAMKPYWEEIGELLLEAKEQFDTNTEFIEWGERQFGKSKTQLYRYMQAVTSVPNSRRRENTGGGGGRQSLSDALRSAGTQPRGHHGLGAREWISPVDNIADRARRDAERIREQELTRQQEREAERQLALRLIDIGYKVLAKELHPDAGGSREAMSRLHTVRDRLKAHA